MKVNLNINKQLLPMKTHFFLFNAGNGPVVSFLSTYAKQLGFSSIVVGLIYTILPIFALLGRLVAGFTADRFKCQKKIFIGAQIVTAISFLCIFYSPTLPINRTVQFSCLETGTTFDTSPTNTTFSDCFVTQLQEQQDFEECHLSCKMTPEQWGVVCGFGIQKCPDNKTETFEFNTKIPTNKINISNDVIFFQIFNITVDDIQYQPSCSEGSQISTTCDVECNNYIINEIIETPTIQDETAYSLYQFWVFFLFMIISWTAQSTVVCVTDAICFAMLGENYQAYGFQRMFGSLGWGIFGTIAGFMLDLLSVNQSKKQFISAFYLGFGLIILDVIISYTMKYKQSQTGINIFKNVGKLFLNIRILIYFIWCILMGMCTALIWTFLFWLLEDLAKTDCDTQKWIKTLEGVIIAIQCVGGEAPFLFFTGWFLRNLGHINCMTMILFVVGIRFVLYSVITEPWFFIPVELLNGVTYGLFYAVMTSYASIVAPSGTETTVQGVVGALFEGVGVSLGSFIAGLFYNAYGGQICFRIFGIGAIILSLVHAGVQFLIKVHDRKIKNNFVITEMKQDENQIYKSSDKQFS